MLDGPRWVRLLEFRSALPVDALSADAVARGDVGSLERLDDGDVQWDCLMTLRSMVINHAGMAEASLEEEHCVDWSRWRYSLHLVRRRLVVASAARDSASIS